MAWYNPSTWGSKPKPQEGTIFLKPSEKGQVDEKSLADRGISVQVPGGSSGGGGGGSSGGGGGARGAISKQPQATQEQLTKTPPPSIDVASTSVTQVQNKKPSITGPQPDAVNTFNPVGRGVLPTDISTREKFSYLGKTYGSSGIYKESLKNFYGAGTGTPIVSGVSTFFRPLGIFNTPQGDIVTSVPWRGTKMDEGFTPAIYKPMTDFERAKYEADLNKDLYKPIDVVAMDFGKGLSSDIEKDIRPTYQGRVNAGEDIDKVSKEYQAEFTDLYSSQIKAKLEGSPKIKGQEAFNKRYGKSYNPIVDIPKVAEFGAVVGAGAVAPVFTGAYIYGSGVSSGYEGLSEKNYTKAGLGFGIALTGVGFSMKSLGSQIDNIRIADAVKSQQRLGFGVRTQKGNSFVDVTKFSGERSGIRVNTDVVGRGTVGKDGFVYSGEQTQTITGRTDWGNKFFSTTTIKEFSPTVYDVAGAKVLKAGSSINLGGDASFGNINLGERTIFKSRAYEKGLFRHEEIVKPIKIRIDAYTDVPFSGDTLVAGVSKKIKTPGGEFIISEGGAVESISAPIDVTRGRGFTFVEGGKIDFKIPDISKSLLKVVNIEEGATMGSSFQGGFSGKTTTLGTKTIAPDFTSQLSKSFTSTITPPVSPKIVPITSQIKSPLISSGQSQFPLTFGLPSMVGGAGLDIKQVTRSGFGTSSGEQSAFINTGKLNFVPLISSKSFNEFSPTRVSSDSLNKGRQVLTPLSISAIKQKPLAIQGQSTRLGTLTKQLQGTVSAPALSMGGYPQPLPPPPRGIIPFALPFGGERSGGLGRLKASRTYSYFPSFKAFAFGIRGKGTKPLATKRWTGLEVRPIFDKKKFKLQKFRK